MDGVIIKAYGGFYFVRAVDRELKCTIRGKVRRQYGQVLVGDRVRVVETGDGQGVVEALLLRRCALTRPPVANVDQAVIIFSFTEPEPNAVLLDRFLVQAQAAGVDPVICFNKLDLAGPGECAILEHYERAGHPLLQVSAKTGANIERLREILRGRISVFAGPSGVGKSSLLNALQPGLKLKTGEVSRKLKRGRHTTRHVELIPLAGGFVADTPGFSSLQLPPMSRQELAGYFPEFTAVGEQCRFADCLHRDEPGCAVKQAVQLGRLSPLRYRHYLEFLDEVINGERRY